MPIKTLLRNLRLVSGLVLMLFIVVHLVNLVVGLHSLGAMGAAKVWLLDAWRTPVGAGLLVVSALGYMALALYALSIWRSGAMSRTDAVQMVLGLLTPLLLITHVMAAHAAAEYDRNFNFV